MESKDIENIENTENTENIEITKLKYKLECLTNDLKYANKLKEERFAYRDLLIKQLNSEVFELKKENKLLSNDAYKYFEIEQIINRKLRPIVYV
jgi:hypothetical protein